MKKSFLTICAVLACVMGFVACSSNDDEKKAEEVSIVGKWSCENITVQPAELQEMIAGMISGFLNIELIADGTTDSEYVGSYKYENDKLTLTLKGLAEMTLGPTLVMDVKNLADKSMQLQVENLTIMTMTITKMTINMKR